MTKHAKKHKAATPRLKARQRINPIFLLLFVVCAIAIGYIVQRATNAGTLTYGTLIVSVTDSTYGHAGIPGVLINVAATGTNAGCLSGAQYTNNSGAAVFNNCPVSSSGTKSKQYYIVSAQKYGYSQDPGTPHHTYEGNFNVDAGANESIQYYMVAWDSDGDGISDVRDSCPNAAYGAGNGCPPPPPPAVPAPTQPAATTPTPTTTTTLVPSYTGPATQTVTPTYTGPAVGTSIKPTTTTTTPATNNQSKTSSTQSTSNRPAKVAAAPKAPSGSVAAADTQPPATPSSLVATEITPGTVQLTWPASTDNTAVTGYMVERSSDQQTWDALVSGATDLTYTDTDGTFNAHYYYRVSAVDAAGNQSGSVLTDITTSAFEPNATKDKETIIKSSDGTVTAVIPAGAIDEPALCSLPLVTPSKSSIPKDYQLVSGAYTFSCETADGGSIALFQKPISMTVVLAAAKNKTYHLYQLKDGKLTDSKAKYQAKTPNYSLASTSPLPLVVLVSKSSSISWLFILLGVVGLIVLAFIAFIVRRRLANQREYDDYVRERYLQPNPLAVGGAEHSPLDRVPDSAPVMPGQTVQPTSVPAPEAHPSTPTHPHAHGGYDSTQYHNPLDRLNDQPAPKPPESPDAPK